MTPWVEYNQGQALHAHEAIEGALHSLLDHGDEVNPGHWQGYPTEGRPDLVTKEIINLTFTARIPATVEELVQEVKPNLPWAETEFLERVGRTPRNPHRSLDQWPHWNGQIETPFTHTYSERFWPAVDEGDEGTNHFRQGIRYRYGDLDDVVKLLRREPNTRQATFPIFFPEDTGGGHMGRIPCTLHYHFLRRDQRLHMWYAIRSCDAYRHFRDDIYLAMRLCQWVLNELQYGEQKGWRGIKPGVLCFAAYSFHVHMGDLHKLTIT